MGINSRMKETFTIINLFLVCAGVFGDEVKSVLVMEGDSVTLHTNITEIQTGDLVWWMFIEGDSKSLLAEIGKHKIWYTPERFKEKLLISDTKTGDLTIKNMKIKYSGLYEVEINIDTETSYKRFDITVIESPRFINTEMSVVKSVSVTEGKSVTLQTDVKLQTDDLILWRFGDESILIAKGDIEDNKTSVYDDDDERFRDRLKMNDQTGDLTITKSKTKHTGVYQLKISSNKQTLYKTFSVTVSESGLSSAVIIGLCVFFLLVGAGVIGLILYRRRISKLEYEVKLMSVVEGESVTLHTYIELQKDAVVEWMYGNDKIIAKIKDKQSTTDDEVLEGKFKDRLKLDRETGSLTITEFKVEHIGLYEVKITSSKGTPNSKFKSKFNSKFNVYLKARVRTGKMGKSVTLDTGVTEIQRDDEILWTFEDMTIAEYTGGTDKPTLYKIDERFKDKLEMNHQTGDLTIRHFKSEHTGVYKVQIKNSNGTKNRTFYVAFYVEAMKGGSVTLYTKFKIKEGDEVEWTSDDKTSLVTGMNGDDSKTSYTDDERFRSRLTMNPETGDLTIRDIRQTDAVYTLKLINTDKKITYRIFNVSAKVQGNFLKQQNLEMIRTVKLGESVTLDTCVAKIQRDDEIMWMFRDMRIARYIGDTDESTLYDYIDERFKDKLKVNHQTGDLTIRNFRTDHTGVYKVKIKNSSGTKDRRFCVALYVQDTKGASITLFTKLKINNGDEVEWTSKDKTTLVTGMNGDDSKTSYKDDVRFRGRLKMKPGTGDLIITDLRQTDEGVYTLQVTNTDGKITYRIFYVDVFAKAQNQQISVQAMKGRSVTLCTKVNIQHADAVEWTSEDKTSLVTGMNGDGRKTTYTDDERFRGRLKMNAQTGDLTITDIRQTDDGDYKLQLTNSDGKITYRIFNVEVTGLGNIQNQQNSDSAGVRDESVAVMMPLLNKDNRSSSLPMLHQEHLQ
nr:uncharacterized protein LOC129454073 isoform X1 [Misgurnus anguillicaudatus]